MTFRAALYARYSSDQQRAASIEDQFRVCREHAEREGWTIACAYKDSAVSGDSVILRPGVQALLEDARRGLFEVVVAEGEINELHVDLKGTMNALFLKDLAAKTHRGIRGRVEAGKAGGGRSYLRRGEGTRRRGRADARRAGDQRTASGHRAAHLPGVRFGHEPARDCAGSERGRRSRPEGQAVERQHAARACESGHGGAQQRALYRPAGVEPASRDEGPGDGMAGDAAQPAGRLDRRRGSRASHRGRRTVAGGAGGTIRGGDRGGAGGECDAGPGPLFLFEPCHDRRLHEPQEHPALGSGGAGAPPSRTA